MFLNDQEIRQLTGKRHRDAQILVLNAMGIEHKTRPDGSIVVLVEHVKNVLDSSLACAKKEEVEPNWEGLR